MKLVSIFFLMLFIYSCSISGSSDEKIIKNENKAIQLNDLKNNNLKKEFYQTENIYENENYGNDKIEMKIENPIPESFGINYLPQSSLDKKTLLITGNADFTTVKKILVTYSNKDLKIPAKIIDIPITPNGYDGFSFHASSILNFYGTGENVYSVDVVFKNNLKNNIKIVINVPKTLVLK
ncbi:MAG: hypothetical protein PHH98_05685 [Candidatus Gracilibacteria bacterium]|nr:hypothetical protein [Candidatus Gracilibacteria bacterium]